MQDIGTYLANAGDGTADDPIDLPVDINLASGGWADLLSTISGAGKYVALDLSDCDMDGMTSTAGEFDPGTADTGEKFIASLVLPEAAESVKAGSLTFRYFTALKSVAGKEVETIGSYAFQGLTALETVDFPNAETISRNAFRDCTNLTTVTIPKALTIDDNAFTECKALTEISLPMAETIRGGAFENSGLTKADFPNAVIDSGYIFHGCTSLIEVNLPKTVTIGSNFFDGCSALEEVSSPATSIGFAAFDHCIALKTVDLPNAISIGNIAFRDCTALKTVNLPKATSFGYQVFQNTGTGALTITLGPTAPTLGTSMFAFVSDTKKVTVNVPNKATGYNDVWQSSFTDNNANINLTIEEEEDTP
jgi:hypothetical protein